MNTNNGLSTSCQGWNRFSPAFIGKHLPSASQTWSHLKSQVLYLCTLLKEAIFGKPISARSVSVQTDQPTATKASANVQTTTAPTQTETGTQATVSSNTRGTQTELNLDRALAQVPRLQRDIAFWKQEATRLNRGLLLEQIDNRKLHGDISHLIEGMAKLKVRLEECQHELDNTQKELRNATLKELQSSAKLAQLIGYSLELEVALNQLDYTMNQLHERLTVEQQWNKALERSLGEEWQSQVDSLLLSKPRPSR